MFILFPLKHQVTVGPWLFLTAEKKAQTLRANLRDLESFSYDYQLHQLWLMVLFPVQLVHELSFTATWFGSCQQKQMNLCVSSYSSSSDILLSFSPRPQTQVPHFPSPAPLPPSPTSPPLPFSSSFLSSSTSTPVSLPSLPPLAPTPFSPTPHPPTTASPPSEVAADQHRSSAFTSPTPVEKDFSLFQNKVAQVKLG